MSVAEEFEEFVRFIKIEPPGVTGGSCSGVRPETLSGVATVPEAHVQWSLRAERIVQLLQQSRTLEELIQIKQVPKLFELVPKASGFVGREEPLDILQDWASDPERTGGTAGQGNTSARAGFAEILQAEGRQVRWLTTENLLSSVGAGVKERRDGFRSVTSHADLTLECA